MNLKMKTLAAAVIAAGTLGTAQASSVLFPYVVNGGSVTTIVTVVDVNAAYAVGYPNLLHRALWYKDGAKAEDNLAACVEVNQWLPSSSNDVQTVDLGGKFGSTTKGVLFNDPSINNNWVASGKRFDMANLATKPLRGYLLVDDEVPASGFPRLEGEAMVFEFATGASWGYTAGMTNGTDFRRDVNINVAPSQNVSIKPWGETTTKFFVTPINVNMFAGNNTVGRDDAAIDPAVTNDVASDTLVSTLTMLRSGVAMYDRDENPVSGTVGQSVTCVGALDATTRITSSAKTLLPDGGWGQLNVENYGVSPDNSKYRIATNASVIKLDYNSKATFNGETVTGTFNNAFQLR